MGLIGFAIGGVKQTWITDYFRPVDVIAEPEVIVAEAKRQVFGGIGIDMLAGQQIV